MDIYLDHQASSSPGEGVVRAMMPYFSDSYGNPHSGEHAWGWRASDAIDTARRQVAMAIGADAGEVIFTSGATEANNMAILGFDRETAPRLLTTAIEHKSVLAPMRERARRGSALRIVPVDSTGVIDLDVLRAALRDGVDLVSVMAVNNEVGTAQPLCDVASLCRQAGALLHVDAAQALAYRALDWLAVDADFMSLSAHKAGGPKGVGALIVAHRSRSRLSPIFFGGGQEDGLRPGTLPTPLCVGFGAACLALPDPGAVAGWRDRADRLAGLLAAGLAGTSRNGGGDGRHPGNVSVTLAAGEADAIIARLQPSLAVATGSACTSGIPEPSHVLRAMGLDAAAANRTIRLSVGRNTTEAEIDEAARLLISAARSIP